MFLKELDRALGVGVTSRPGHTLLYEVTVRWYCSGLLSRMDPPQKKDFKGRLMDKFGGF